MASSTNVVVLVGNLTKDPETREVGETSVTTLRLAVNERRKVSGEWTDVASYFNVSVWGAQGENCEKFLAKGRPVAVQGSLRQREYTDKDGNKREAVDINAFAVQFLGSKDDKPARDIDADF